MICFLTSRSLAFLAGLLLAAPALVQSVLGQNLLTNNAGFEANTAYYAPGWGYPQGSPDALPGWVITLDPTGDGYAGAATNQSPPGLEGTHFGYIYSGTGLAGSLETAPGSRAPVQAGTTYTLWFLARGDASWGQALAAVGLVWYPNQTESVPLDATNLNLTLAARVSTNDPMQVFFLTAVAPPGASYAAARITRPAYDYAPVILDDFVIMAEPMQVSLFITQRGPNATLRWSRSARFQPQENSNPANPNGWLPVTRPIRGLGATNYLDYPLIENTCFFRLSGLF